MCYQNFMKISVDVVIPSFRLQEKYILPVLNLAKPADSVIKFYIVVDNPAIEPPAAIQSLVNNKNVFLIINKQNLGAAETRNIGIAAGTGDWILLLDDDIIVSESLLEIYVNAIKEHPGEIGFLGLINFPEPSKNFTRAITVSGSMDIFSIANRKNYFVWGATANTMIKRNAISNIKFSTVYPKSGGGEDVDFFLKVSKKNNYLNFKTLPAAVVQHPWWNNEKADFRRPFRYGKGNSHLGELNPEHTYYDFLNTPETLLVCIIISFILFFTKHVWLVAMLIFITGVLMIEISASAIQTIKRDHKATLGVIMYNTALRFVYECGLLYGKISGLQLWRIGERFHDDGSINKVFFYRTNTYKIVKWILYPLLIFFILYKYI